MAIPYETQISYARELEAPSALLFDASPAPPWAGWMHNATVQGQEDAILAKLLQPDVEEAHASALTDIPRVLSQSTNSSGNDNSCCRQQALPPISARTKSSGVSCGYYESPVDAVEAALDDILAGNRNFGTKNRAWLPADREAVLDRLGRVDEYLRDFISNYCETSSMEPMIVDTTACRPMNFVPIVPSPVDGGSRAQRKTCDSMCKSDSPSSPRAKGMKKCNLSRAGRLVQISHVISWLEKRDECDQSLEALCSKLQLEFGDETLSRNVLSKQLDGEILIYTDSFKTSVVKRTYPLATKDDLEEDDEGNDEISIELDSEYLRRAFIAAQQSPVLRNLINHDTIFIAELGFAVYNRQPRHKQAMYTVGSRFTVKMTMLVAVSVSRGCILMSCVPGSPDNVNINTFVIDTVRALQDQARGVVLPVTVVMPSFRASETRHINHLCGVVGLSEHDEKLNIAGVLLEIFAKAAKDQYGRFRQVNRNAFNEKQSVEERHQELGRSIHQSWLSYSTHSLMNHFRTKLQESGSFA